MDYNYQNREAAEKRRKLRRLIATLGLTGLSLYTLKKGLDIKQKTEAEKEKAKKTAWLKKIMPNTNLDLSDIVKGAGDSANLAGDIMNLIKTKGEIKKGKEDIEKNKKYKDINKTLAKDFYTAKQKYSPKDLVAALMKQNITPKDLDSDDFEGIDEGLKEKYLDVLKNKHFSQKAPVKIYKFSDPYYNPYQEEDEESKWLKRLKRLAGVAAVLGTGYLVKQKYDSNKAKAEMKEPNTLMNQIKVTDLINPVDKVVSMVGKHVGNVKKDVDTENKDILKDTKDSIKHILKHGVEKTKKPETKNKTKSSAGDVTKDIGDVLKALAPFAKKVQDYKTKG